MRSDLNFLTFLKDPQLRMFVEDLLFKYWDISNLPIHQIPSILNILASYSEEPEFALQLVYDKFPDLTDKESEFYSMYQEARFAKFRKFSRSIAPYIRGAVLADIGGEDTQLVEALMSMLPTIRKSYVTDINQPNQLSQNDQISFLWQSKPDETPLKNREVDTIVLSTMLHHIVPHIRIKLASHLKEVLREGGRLILIEDTFPEKPQESDVRNLLDRRFLAFSDKHKMRILSFLDWWGNRLMKNSRDIPLPCTFKSMEQWEIYFAKLGLKAIQLDYLGIPDMHTHVMAPKGVLVFENGDDAASQLNCVQARVSKSWNFPKNFFEGARSEVLSKIKRFTGVGTKLNEKSLSQKPNVETGTGCTQGNFNSIINSIVRADSNLEMTAFIPKQGVSVNLNIGGSKILTSVIDRDYHEIIDTFDYSWRKDLWENFNVDRSDALTKRKWFIDRIVDQVEIAIQKLNEMGVDAAHVEGVGIAWAGPVKQNGLLVGPNIDGFKFCDLSQNERECGGIFLKDMIADHIKKRLALNNLSIQILNDGDAAAIAHYRGAHLENGFLLTLGTGLGSGIVSQGNVLYSVDGFQDRIGEIGHHILFHPTYHRYFYYGVLTRGRIVEEMTPYSISQRLAGPGLAKKYVSRLKREMGKNSDKLGHFLNSEQSASTICFSEIEIEACQANDDLGPILEKKILKLITNKALEGNKSAICFVREVGYEMGLGIGVFIKEFETEEYVRNLIISGTIGKKFGKGLLDENGNDLFLAQISKGIEWSIGHHYTEMNAQLMANLCPGFRNGSFNESKNLRLSSSDQ